MLRRIGKGVEYTAFSYQVSEHQKTDERNRGRRNNPGDDGYNDRKQNARGFADFLLLIGHTDQALMAGGQCLNYRRLNNRHQCHIGIGRHHDSALILGIEHLGDENGGGAVCRADDSDGSGIVCTEKHGSNTEGKENAKLGRRAKDQQFWIGQQRAEVDHGADSDKQDQREQLVGDPRVEQGRKRALLYPTVHRLVYGTGKRNIDQNGTKTQRQQQRRLHIFGNRQVDQQTADGPHDPVTPVGQRCKVYKQAADFFKNHCQSPHV